MQLSGGLRECLEAVEEKEDGFERLWKAVERLREEEGPSLLSSSSSSPPPSSSSSLEDWFQGLAGASRHASLELETLGGGKGRGWVARHGPVVGGSPLFVVPSAALLTEAALLTDPTLAALQGQLSVLRQFSSALIALFLLVHRARSDSPWRPYIDALPTSYSVPLYWSWNELSLLRGGSAWSLAHSFWKNAVRLYAIVAHVCRVHAKELKLVRPVTFDDWRWALSAVFTRRNALPSTTGEGLGADVGNAEGRLALIPVWDMCNHEDGPMSTGLDPNSGSIVCYAMRDFKQGEEVTMCYGPRSWADLLVHNGFLPESEAAFGPNDYFPLRLALNPNEAFYAARVAFLKEAQGLPAAADYALRTFAPGAAALAFARVARLAGPLPAATPGVALKPLSPQNEKDACQFLSMAIAVALRRLPTVDEQDNENYIRQCCRRLRRAERALLEGFLKELEGYAETISSK